jgi:error-prone DNA polymerase
VFTHLHLHSYYSFGIGASSPEALVAAARARGMDALACTDTNGVYGAVEFQRAAESLGLRPILGAHLSAGGQETVALACDERGWAALCRAITAIHWRGSGKAGKQDSNFSLADQIAHDREGLVLLSSDITLLEQVLDTSGPQDLYAELIPGKRRHAVLAAARRMGLKPVATNAVVAANAEDWARHRLLRAISQNVAISACPPESLASRDAWLRSPADIARYFPDCPDALTNAAAIAEQCRYRIPWGRVVPPRFAAHDDAMVRLRALAYEGADRRYGTVAPITRDRLEHELGIIALKGFADYFLVVRDIVQQGPTHCGRGSVANSVVSYCLGITHVEPLGAGLLFERFLNPERRDPPDIDLDFPWDERDQVLAYVFRRYPHPRAAMVANHNCFRLRGALREVAKVHGRPPGEIREVTRRIPWYEDDSLTTTIEQHPNFTSLELPGMWSELARMAEPLVGIPRHLSLHPGGVVIVPDALTDFVPIEPAVKTLDRWPGLTVPVIQFEKDGAEDAGLVKIDLLGNRSLAVIRDAIDAVRRHTGRQIDYTSEDPGEDPKTREHFRTGRTMGVFYTESPASRLLCEKSQAESFELLVLNTSIIRPASNRFIKVYLERLHGKPYEPMDPVLRDTLSETFGIMVFQEDVVNVCAVFAGMSLATGDGLRKALSKKRPHKHLVAYAEEFFTGAAALGRAPGTAKQVWEMIMSFAGYSFCKGHSCSYIRVAQHSCYLRANYPAEFYAAVLSNGGGFYHPFAYVAEAMRNGIRFLGPDVNASDFRCIGREDWIRVGLQFVKGLSADGVERVGAGRRGGGEAGEAGKQFRSIEDFRARTGLSHDDLRTLIKVGALDSIAGDKTRPMMLWEVDQAAGNHDNSDQLLPRLPTSPLPRLKEYTQERRRREQLESLGFLTDAHPMDLHAESLGRLRLVKSGELHRHAGKSVLAAGMLTTAKPVHTHKDEPMQFATFDDGTGLIETVLFPDVYRDRGHVLFDQGPFVFRGKVEVEFGAVTVTITQLDRLERMLRRVSNASSG